MSKVMTNKIEKTKTIVFRRNSVVRSAFIKWNPRLKRQEVEGEPLEDIKKSAEWCEVYKN